MKNEWMIDVLTDLRKFAAQQAMLDLAEHLDDAILVAAVELRTQKDGLTVSEAYEHQDRSLSGTFIDSGHTR